MSKTNKKMQKLALSAMFLALSYVLPFFTGQIPDIGNMLCPMHLPVLLCGFICGGPWGMLVGFIAPLLRSLTLGMPMLFPKAVAMAFELATYGFMAGFLYKLLPKKKIFIYVSLISSMIAGRLVWGLVQFICLGFNTEKFGLAFFWTEAFVLALPGIILQMIMIPLVIILIESRKALKKESNYESKK